MLRSANRLKVLLFDIGTVLVIVALGEQHAGVTGAVQLQCNGRQFVTNDLAEHIQRAVVNIANNRATDQNGIVLFGRHPRVSHVIDAVVDAADKAQFAINDDHLAVQTAEQVGAHTHESRTRVEQLNLNTGIDHGFDKHRTQVRCPVVIYRDNHFRAVGRSLEQRLLQALANPVFKDDESLDQHLFARGPYALEHPGVEVFTVDQQLYRVAITPLPCRITHKVNSTASGA